MSTDRNKLSAVGAVIGNFSPSYTCSKSLEFCLLGESDGNLADNFELFALFTLPAVELSPLSNPDPFKDAFKEWSGCGTRTLCSLRPEDRRVILGFLSFDKGNNGMALLLCTRSLEGWAVVLLRISDILEVIIVATSLTLVFETLRVRFSGRLGDALTALSLEGGRGTAASGTERPRPVLTFRVRDIYIPITRLLGMEFNRTRYEKNPSWA